jgi:hypothetical protein
MKKIKQDIPISKLEIILQVLSGIVINLPSF